MTKITMNGWVFVALDVELGRLAMNRVFELGGTAVNKNTAMAVSGGTNYEPKYKDVSHIDFFKEKPPIPKIPKLSSQIREQAKKHIGERRSRLVVVAWFGAGGRWLCRCDCGYYIVRKLSFLEKKDNFDACLECRFVIQKRRHNHWLTTGKELPEEYFA